MSVSTWGVGGGRSTKTEETRGQNVPKVCGHPLWVATVDLYANQLICSF